MTPYDRRGISPEQQGELVKQFTLALARRSHAEGCALLESSIGWYINEFLNEKCDFTCDWVESDLEYPAAYKGLRPVEEQVQLLASTFRLDPKPALKVLEKGLPAVPAWAEGWAAVPIQEKLPSTYANLAYKSLTWHSSVCGNRPRCHSSHGAPEGLNLEDHVLPHFANPEVGKRGSVRRKFTWWWELKVGGCIMIVPVQMGAMRRGQSDRMVKAQCRRKDMSEFPLGIFEVACLLAMHPKRVPEYNEKALQVNAPGDEYTYQAYLKSSNCHSLQMGHWWTLGKGELPSFGFASSNLKDASHGPVTASQWDFKSHLGA
jgi:hypothetical protein